MCGGCFCVTGSALTATGIVLGIGVAIVLTRVMSAFLFGVGPMDPVTYAAVSGALAASRSVATYLPARRASRVDPVVALRDSDRLRRTRLHLSYPWSRRVQAFSGAG